MALEEYKKKRRFGATPEPAGGVSKRPQFRFVVQKHRASRLHFDFRLEMKGVLVSWAVPKGPSLDPADKRLAMHVEDHPISYFHFEGIIPEGNYGAGTVEVWDTGTWEPILDWGKEDRGNQAPAAKKISKTDAERAAVEMYEKGDFKFRLSGEKLHGAFVLAKMKRARYSKDGHGKDNEWLLIKKRDEAAVAGFDANSANLDWSVLTKRSLDQIAGDQASAEWQSNRAAAPGKAKDSWIKQAIVRREQSAQAKKPSKIAAKTAPREPKTKTKAMTQTLAKAKTKAKTNKKTNEKTKTSAKKSAQDKEGDGGPAPAAIAQLQGARRAPMPQTIHPMLATLVDKVIDDPKQEWLYEIKWDGYRAVCFVANGNVRLLSRNGNDLTADFPELREIASRLNMKRAVLDGEICALDPQGRSSFSLMQQRSGFRDASHRGAADRNLPIVYYLFDLLYADGYSLVNVTVEERKRLLATVFAADERFRLSEDFSDGPALFAAARAQQLEGIVAKKRSSGYVEKRSREWLKIKITQTQECVIGGYTDPKGSRENYGSLVLGLYDRAGKLIHVGQAGSGFTHKSHAALWTKLTSLETNKSPFANKVEANRRVHFVRPELVAQIKFTEWTHEGQNGGVKMRAPVFQGLRADKSPRQCLLEEALPQDEEALPRRHGGTEKS